MNTQDVVKMYLIVAAIYLVSRVYKLIRKTDGVSGWNQLKKKAIEEDVMIPEIFAYMAVFTLITCTILWPVTLVEMLLIRGKSGGGKS